MTYALIVLVLASTISAIAVAAWWLRGVVLASSRAARVQAAADRDQSVRAAMEAMAVIAAERLGSTAAATESALDARSQLVGSQMAAMSEQVAHLRHVLSGIEAERHRHYGDLSAQLRATAEGTAALLSTTGALNQALANPTARGQWGERMADDVLRAAGFVEGVNFVRQRSIPASGTVPDVTFLLPHERVLHMDVKFPIAAYLRHLEADTDLERERWRRDFLRDVRLRLKELSGRGYVDPSSGTVEFVLLFIPNESVWSFIHAHDPTLVDSALAQRVVLCSPTSLFAQLALIRQAVDAYAVERASEQVLGLLAAFDDQYRRFTEQLEAVHRRFDGVAKEYETLVTTRRRSLERPLRRIDELRREHGVGVAELGEGGEAILLRAVD